MSPAPFRSLPGDPPPLAEARWLAAGDGVRLRAALWRAQAGTRTAATGPALRADPAGTVLLFPGRTEYVEKYAGLAALLAAAGLDVLGIDWRGQGLSDRLLADPRPGHVGDFADYQKDVDALTAHATALDLPRPWFLLAHSMGGAIGLRALGRGLPVAAAAFSAPMWGIRIGRLPAPIGRRVASGIAGAAGRAGRGTRATPGAASVLDVAFSANLLTRDLDAYVRLMREAAAWPDMRLGPASWDWVRAAMAECRALAALPPPAIPALVSLSGAEAIVAPAPIRARVAAWPGATLLEFPGARHEALFETADVRERFVAAILETFTA